MYNMKRMFILILVLFVGTAHAVATPEFSCGPGYVLVDHKKIDGIDAAECQKLWCVDLETGKAMGRGNTANSGYKSTAYPYELRVGNKSVTCWGERKWCAGQVVGDWDESHGMYTRGAYNPDTAYQSYQKGSCFTWKLEEHNCPAGQTAFLGSDGVWDCRTEQKTVDQVRGSAIRRTSAPRRIIR